MISPISFKAKYLTTESIQKASETRYIPASVVELDSRSCKDRDAFSEVNESWENGCSLARHVMANLDDNSIIGDVNRRFIVLTLQRQNFDKLIPQKVLGVAEVLDTEDYVVELMHLQADPENNMLSSNPKYKGIGSALLRVIKKMFPDSDITLFSSEKAEEFYHHHGFETLDRFKRMIFRR